jgi:branched-chain amino acid transport system permease protein
MSAFVNTLFNGFAFSGLLFLLSVGLTLILGLIRVVNFAHGVLFILGGYMFVMITNATNSLILGILVSIITLAVVGGFIEFVLLKRVYGRGHLAQIIITFGVVLIAQDVIKLIWSNVPYNLTAIPTFLQGSVDIGDVTVPKNSIFIIGVAILMGIILLLILNKTKLGKRINAASLDTEMANALGMNVPFLFTSVFILGSACAAVAGALLSLKVSLVPALSMEYLIYAFAVVIIGGLGSFKGSIYGSLIVGICYSFGIMILPNFAMIFIFALLLLTLLIRPRGLFGVVEEERTIKLRAEEGKTIILPGLKKSSKRVRQLILWGAIIVLLIVLSRILPTFWVLFITEILILILLASSLNMVIGSGLVSLAHAAFFGAGAYISSVVLIQLTSSLFLSIAISVVGAAIIAFVIGILSLRHVELYFTLITLAFAQFFYTLVFKWKAVTGGDDGLMGIPFPSINVFGLTGEIFTPDSTLKYLYYVLVFVVIGLVFIRIILNSPFGQVLHGIRENTERVSFLGLNPKKFKVAVFVIAGGLAGLAGALFAPFQMVISPIVAHWSKSVEPIFMNIIGGTATNIGPGIGAAVYLFFKDTISSITEYWRIWFGLLLIAIILVFPQGIIGYSRIAIAKIVKRTKKSRTQKHGNIEA